MTRTSTLTGCGLAERVDFAVLEEPQQLGLELEPISPISSRNSVPPSAARMTPLKAVSAPVNAPRR